MWLLNSKTGDMTEFLSDNDAPPYAILSHTWGDEEVSFADWRALQAHASGVKAKEGFRKIEFCCRQAVKDGLGWVWVDTWVLFWLLDSVRRCAGPDCSCCIDKTSSAELSEAINSMFKWYKKAAICYAHLADVEEHGTGQEVADGLSRSRWFTRGWTLQELIAPDTIKFYSRDWHFLGTKAELCDMISSISGIEVSFLRGRDLEQASVSKRMSWASGRQTTRDEDIAYCLLGIFGLCMPLLYGEGKRAFHRLQEEIMKALPDDHTLQHSTWLGYTLSRSGNFDIKLPPWDPAKSGKDFSGMLSQSPADFRHSTAFAPHRDAIHFYNHPHLQASPPTPFGKGVRIDLPYTTAGYSSYHWPQFRVTQMRHCLLVVLLCEDAADPGTALQILVRRSQGGTWARTNEMVLLKRFNIWNPSVPCRKAMLHIAAERPNMIQNGDFVIRQLTCNKAVLGLNKKGDNLGNKFRHAPRGYWDQHTGILRLNENDSGPQLWRMQCPFRAYDNRSLAICLGRIRGPGGTIATNSVCISATPILFDVQSKLDSIQDENGVIWWEASGQAGWDNPLYSHVMPASGGMWTQELETLPSSPVIHAHVKRVFFEDVEGSKFVDVIRVDIRLRTNHRSISRLRTNRRRNSRRRTSHRKTSHRRTRRRRASRRRTKAPARLDRRS